MDAPGLYGVDGLPEKSASRSTCASRSSFQAARPLARHCAVHLLDLRRVEHAGHVHAPVGGHLGQRAQDRARRQHRRGDPDLRRASPIALRDPVRECRPALRAERSADRVPPTSSGRGSTCRCRRPCRAPTAARSPAQKAAATAGDSTVTITFSSRDQESSVQFADPVQTAPPSRTTYLWCIRSGIPGIALLATSSSCGSISTRGGGGTGIGLSKSRLYASRSSTPRLRASAQRLARPARRCRNSFTSYRASPGSSAARSMNPASSAATAAPLAAVGEGAEDLSRLRAPPAAARGPSARALADQAHDLGRVVGEGEQLAAPPPSPCRRPPAARVSSRGGPASSRSRQARAGSRRTLPVWISVSASNSSSSVPKPPGKTTNAARVAHEHHLAREEVVEPQLHVDVWVRSLLERQLDVQADRRHAGLARASVRGLHEPGPATGDDRQPRPRRSCALCGAPNSYSGLSGGVRADPKIDTAGPISPSRANPASSSCWIRSSRSASVRVARIRAIPRSGSPRRASRASGAPAPGKHRRVASRRGDQEVRDAAGFRARRNVGEVRELVHAPDVRA